MSEKGLPRKKYGTEEIALPWSESISEWTDEFYDLLLKDKLRMKAFQKAIQEAVKPGMVILDLGTGTGILAEWALEAGAKRVYGIEQNKDILDQAEKNLAKKGYRKAFLPYHGLSFEIDLPEKVDIIISEILGNLADNENCVPILKDASRRFLKPDGLMLPQKVTSFLVPVEAQKAHDAVKTGTWKGIKNPFDSYFDAILPLSSYLSDPESIRCYRQYSEAEETYVVEKEFQVKKSGVLTGFKGYFLAELTKETTLDISFDNIEMGQTSDSWKHAFLPIQNPIEVKEKDTIRLQFERAYPQQEISHFKQTYRWSGGVFQSQEKRGSFFQQTNI